MVMRPSGRSGGGQETLPEFSKWSEDPPGGTEVVRKLSNRTGSGRETLREVRKWSGDLREVRKWSGDPPSGPEVV